MLTGPWLGDTTFMLAGSQCPLIYSLLQATPACYLLPRMHNLVKTILKYMYKTDLL
jgi:hypothetical protein